MPEGQLTPAQYEIMQFLWEAGRKGATVTDVWQHISQQRSVTRTTVLNLVDRLEKRGWLKRRTTNGSNRFSAAVSRQRATANLADEFVNDFFSGSASNLVMSLLGANRIDPDEITRLKAALDEIEEAE